MLFQTTSERACAYSCVRMVEDTSEASVPTPPGFDALSKAEQMRYLQAHWDQISEDLRSRNQTPIAEERLKRLCEDLSHLHSAFDVLDRLANTSISDSIPRERWSAVLKCSFAIPTLKRHTALAILDFRLVAFVALTLYAGQAL